MKEVCKLPDVEEFIRSRAQLNWSRRMVADALGIDYTKFLAVVKLMPDVRWPANGQSVDFRRYCKDKKGRCTSGLWHSCSVARQVRYNIAIKHNIAGFVGTTREVYDAWRELISVSICQVNRRLRKGVNTLDAFFKPNETHLGWGQNSDKFRN